jgi:hypothetical protein
MTTYNISDLDETLLTDAYSILDHLKTLLNEPNSYIVFKFYSAPEVLRKLCNTNGGDEDWLIITWKEPDLYDSLWLEKTDSCSNPDKYLIGEYIIYVGSHS